MDDESLYGKVGFWGQLGSPLSNLLPADGELILGYSFWLNARGKTMLTPEGFVRKNDVIKGMNETGVIMPEKEYPFRVDDRSAHARWLDLVRPYLKQ